MNLTTFTEQGSKKSYMIMLTFKHIKNILRVLFISEHDSYVLISIFGLANCLFICENEDKSADSSRRCQQRHLPIKIIMQRVQIFGQK